jgi:hypothetical protein
MANSLNPNQSLYVNQSLISANAKYQLIMQADGNLVLYRLYNRYALWSSGTAGCDVLRVVMQGDGNLVIYQPNGRAIWASGTAGNPGSFLVLQDDGNLVIYKPKPIWATNTVQYGAIAEEVKEEGKKTKPKAKKEAPVG